MFATLDLFLAIRGIANLLSTVPGRKVMIFLSAGFELNGERQADLRAAIDALNKANIGVYPLAHWACQPQQAVLRAAEG